MGRKPIPDIIKKNRGTDQPCRLRGVVKGEIVTDIRNVLVNPSVALLATERQKQIFIEKVNYMIALNLMEDVFIDSLVDYAIYREKFEECVVKVQEMGQPFLTRRNEAGKIIGHIENPYIRLAMKYRDIVNSIGSEFGFTPVSRMKLPTSEVKESPLEQIRKIVNGK